MYEFIDIPKDILDKANIDPVLSGYINKTIQRVGIYFGDRVVGFYSPVEEEYKSRMYWRTGNIYILPEYRGKGLATKTILDFFSDKHYGLAHIAKTNLSSLKAFIKAGFKYTDTLPDKNPKGIDLLVFIKEPISILPAFSKW